MHDTGANITNAWRRERGHIESGASLEPYHPMVKQCSRRKMRLSGTNITQNNATTLGAAKIIEPCYGLPQNIPGTINYTIITAYITLVHPEILLIRCTCGAEIDPTARDIDLSTTVDTLSHVHANLKTFPPDQPHILTQTHLALQADDQHSRWHESCAMLLTAKIIDVASHI